MKTVLIKYDVSNDLIECPDRIVDNFEDPGLRMKRQQEANRKYSKSVLAILLPVLYCLIDAAGTFVDTLIADNYLVKLAPLYQFIITAMDVQRYQIYFREIPECGNFVLFVLSYPFPFQKDVLRLP